jgi:hypothetical protein
VIPFLGGVCDPLALRGFVPIAPATVIAVDLGTGGVLWRQSRIGRPVAATTSRLVTIAARGEAFVLRLFDAATGRDAGTAEPESWPRWAQGGDRLDAMQVKAIESAGGIRLQWQIHHGYGGAAAPSSAVLAESQQDASGEMILDIDTGRSAPVAPAASVLDPTAELHVAGASGAQDVVQIGTRQFSLRVERHGASKAIVLAAQDTSTGTAWETRLGEAAARPGPLRK